MKQELGGLFVKKDWCEIFEEPNLAGLEKKILPSFLAPRRWFGSKTLGIERIKIVDRLVPLGSSFASLILQVRFNQKKSAHTKHNLYYLPISYVLGKPASLLKKKFPHCVVSSLTVGSEQGLLIDAIYDERFRQFLLNLILSNGNLRTNNAVLSGKLSRSQASHFRSRKAVKHINGSASTVLSVEQSNSSILFHDNLFMKVYRKLENGLNPDSELLSFLSEKTKFKHAPKFIGSISRKSPKEDPIHLALLQTFTKNKCDAWVFTRLHLNRFYRSKKKVEMFKETDTLFSSLGTPIANSVKKQIGAFIEYASLLGRRTAELHLSLASSGATMFKAEPFTIENQRNLLHSLKHETKSVMNSLRNKIDTLSPDEKHIAQSVLDQECFIQERLERILKIPIGAYKIRIHGDYHLGQVLYTGKDFVIIDFEGEPMRSIRERRKKRPVFQDLAGMVRSFHYAAYAALFQSRLMNKLEQKKRYTDAEFWFHFVSQAFLKSYFDVASGSVFLPQSTDASFRLFQTYMLSKAVYELSYELNNRPDWVMIPLKGIQQIMEFEINS